MVDSCPPRCWCTKQMKIIPLEQFVGLDEAISYIGIQRTKIEGYISTKPPISNLFFHSRNRLVKADIIRLLEESGLDYQITTAGAAALVVSSALSAQI